MAQLPKHRVELIGKGVTGACIALVTLLVNDFSLARA